MAEHADSLVEYYKAHRFNPVLIRVEDESVWASHLSKRRNLYERHFGLPLALLDGARVLEFGPNSGENALVPAAHGARLTLVEPNPQVLPRLTGLFEQFGLGGQIDRLACEGVGQFESPDRYDLVVAEGFLYTLPDRDALLRKIAGYVAPGRFGVVSFNDRYGSVLEYLRRAVLFRACELAGVGDPQSGGCLGLARRLFADDFARLNSSRTFDAWWKDTLVNRFCRSAHLWSVPEVLATLADAGCEFYSSSPVWSTSGHYEWYKNTPPPGACQDRVLYDWRSSLTYFLTGIRPAGHARPAPDAVLAAVSDLVDRLCDVEVRPDDPATPPTLPPALADYLLADPNPDTRAVVGEWRQVLASLAATDLDAVVGAYHTADRTRRLWGAAYSYVCFQRPSAVVIGRAA